MSCENEKVKVFERRGGKQKKVFFKLFSQFSAERACVSRKINTKTSRLKWLEFIQRELFSDPPVCVRCSILLVVAVVHVLGRQKNSHFFSMEQFSQFFLPYSLLTAMEKSQNPHILTMRLCVTLDHTAHRLLTWSPWHFSCISNGRPAQIGKYRNVPARTSEPLRPIKEKVTIVARREKQEKFNIILNNFPFLSHSVCIDRAHPICQFIALHIFHSQTTTGALSFLKNL